MHKHVRRTPELIKIANVKKQTNSIWDCNISTSCTVGQELQTSQCGKILVLSVTPTLTLLLIGARQGGLRNCCSNSHSL